MACQGRPVGPGGPGPRRRDDRQGDGRDPVAGRRHRRRAGRRGRQRPGGRRRAGPARGGGRRQRRSRGRAAASGRRSRRRAEEPAPAAPQQSLDPPAVPPRRRRRADAARRSDRRGRAGEKPIASPAVRRRARDAGVDLRQVRGSGPAGRITHDDLDAFLRGAPQAAADRRRGPPTPRSRPIKIIGLRRRIAQKMAESKRRIAHFSYVEEVDVTALEELRATLNAEERPDRPRLTLLPFLMQALVKAVADFPEMNALYDDEAETIERHGGVHIGIATQTPSGLHGAGRAPLRGARPVGLRRRGAAPGRGGARRARRRATSSAARPSPSPASARWAASSPRR